MEPMALKPFAEEVAPPVLPALSRQSILALQKSRGQTPCFQTEARYFCRDATCEWRGRCRCLLAVWRR